MQGQFFTPFYQYIVSIRKFSIHFQYLMYAAMISANEPESER